MNSLVAAKAQLDAAVELANSRNLTNLEKQGLIQAFEFTHELAWNVMRDYFIFQGNPTINGSRDAIREAFQKGMLKDGSVWMEMIQSRNQTSHTYNQAIADEICKKIIGSYHTEFTSFVIKMKTISSNG